MSTQIEAKPFKHGCATTLAEHKRAFKSLSKPPSLTQFKVWHPASSSCGNAQPSKVAGRVIKPPSLKQLKVRRPASSSRGNAKLSKVDGKVPAIAKKRRQSTATAQTKKRGGKTKMRTLKQGRTRTMQFKLMNLSSFSFYSLC